MYIDIVEICLWVATAQFCQICPRNYNGGVLLIHVFIFNCVESHLYSVLRDSSQGLYIPLDPGCVATCTAVWFGGNVPTTIFDSWWLCRSYLQDTFDRPSTTSRQRPTVNSVRDWLSIWTGSGSSMLPPGVCLDRLYEPKMMSKVTSF